VGTDPDGRILLTAWTRIGERSWIVLDPRTLGAHVAPIPSGTNAEPFCLAEDGSIVAVEDGRRVVRYGPEAGERQVLFPRP
jgi:streptogramin lyase